MQSLLKRGFITIFLPLVIMKEFDLVIIGAGPAGYTAAINAAKHKNKSILLIEEKYVGGTCLNEGCIPTKSLIYTANLYEKIKKSKDLGIEIENISLNFSTMQKRKENIVNSLRSGIKQLLSLNKIILKEGSAKFLSEKIISVKEEKIIGKNIIIATGSKPIIPKNISLDNKYIKTSSSILEIEKIPKTLVIIGGGYIGMEFAYLFNALGTKVTILEISPSILSNTDEDIRQSIKDIFIKRNIEILENFKIKNIEENILYSEDGKSIETDLFLLASGRCANIENLDLQNINIANKIFTNDKMETTTNNIYAAGDVKQEIMLAHVAAKEGEVASFNALGIEKTMNYKTIPNVIFTKPEIGYVGLSEMDAKKQNIDIKTDTFPLKALGKAWVESSTDGFVKIIYGNKDQILGAQMIGKHASILIAEMALAIENNITISDVLETIHAHPTFSEVWHEVALTAKKRPIHIFKS